MKNTKIRILITGGSGFIGTNLIEYLESLNKYDLINLDFNKPLNKNHEIYWKNIDILDSTILDSIFSTFQPEWVIHLAAKTETDDFYNLDDYKVNTDGTKNLIQSIQKSISVKHFILTSTQFVHQYHGMPKNDEDFAPHTIYGESKIMSEKILRNSNLGCIWTIIRPTNIWGPWHKRYPQEFWKVLKSGKYFHPGKNKVMRCYGYVGNVVFQIHKILISDKQLIDKQVFYVGDNPINLYDWVNSFSISLNKKSVRVVNRNFVKLLAAFGSFLAFFKIKFPITLSRYKSMTEANDSIPIKKTFEILGDPPYNLKEGVECTTKWLKNNVSYFQDN